VEKDVVQGGNTVTTRYALDGWDPAKADATGLSGFSTWAELNGSNQAQVGYLNGDVVDEVFARIDSNGISWLGEDHLGSVAAVFDNTGRVSDLIGYDGWGNVTSESHPSTGGSLRYAGYSWDTNLGLYHAGARWYDPRSGRWMSQDPLGFDAGDSNLYWYVKNNTKTSLTRVDFTRTSLLLRRTKTIENGAGCQTLTRFG
jgi:RHS repeat-associated protein